MKKKNLFFGITLLSATFCVCALGLAHINKTPILAKADENPLSGTVSTNFKIVWDSSSATADSNNYKLFSDGTNFPLYIDGSSNSTNLFSSTINKNTATENVKIRNYDNANTNYYLYLKYKIPQLKTLKFVITTTRTQIIIYI